MEVIINFVSRAITLKAKPRLRTIPVTLITLVVAISSCSRAPGPPIHLKLFTGAEVIREGHRFQFDGHDVLGYEYNVHKPLASATKEFELDPAVVSQLHKVRSVSQWVWCNRPRAKYEAGDLKAGDVDITLDRGRHVTGQPVEPTTLDSWSLLSITWVLN